MDVFNRLKEKWSPPYVSRKQLWDLTGGIINPKTISHFDQIGDGIKNAIIVGRKTVYPIDDVIEWLRSRSKIITKK